MCLIALYKYEYSLLYIIIDDVILVDQGFLCDEYARMVMAEIKIPPWGMLTGVGSYLQFEFMWRGSLESEKIYRKEYQFHLP